MFALHYVLPCWPAGYRCYIPLPTAIPARHLQCGACRAEPPPFEGAPAAVAYGPAARTVALRLKYGRRLGHARLMATLMLRPLRALAGEGAGEGEALLVPVPLYRWRLWSRGRSEEHTSELQSLMRISYAVFGLKKKKIRLVRADS